MAKVFANLDGKPLDFKVSDLLKWQRERSFGFGSPSPSTGVAVPAIANDGSALRGAPHDALTWIGHASFLVQLGGKSVLIDPVMSDALFSGLSAQRNMPPGLSWSALPAIDLVLITHNHPDHMDGPTLQRLGESPTYVVPRGLKRWFSPGRFPRVVEMDWWQQEEVAGLKITFVPAQHWSRRSAFDQNKSWWGGYVLEHDGLRVYHSGDTSWFDGFAQIAERCGSIEATMLPIGAYEPRWFMHRQHMNPEDAVRAFRALRAKRFVAMHWGTFKLTDEPLEEPPILLRELWAQQGLPEAACEIPAIGQTLRLDR